ncbi:MAG: hypothetical protein COB16_11655 [Rhodobacteraceae bacterium]|nr:MAG: hypothetical protein COB16_11655 [Paracoccaceae bacterium]
MDTEQSIAQVIEAFFDRGFYLDAYPDVAAAQVDPVLHYVRYGAIERRDPTPEFSTGYYLDTYPDVAASGLNPFWHYLTNGRDEGRSGCPGPQEQMRQYFDAEFYLGKNPDVAAGELDPFVHFCDQGWREGRDPSPSFSLSYYRAEYGIPEGVNPLEHYVSDGQQAGFKPHPYRRADGHCVHDDVRHFTQRSADLYETRDPSIAVNRRLSAQAFAMYLPQFHPIPENDVAWGEGFTEWRNVGRGMPRFKGHYQPRIPEILGHYDLLQSDVMARQVQMANEAGLEGFCFYYYRFNQKRALEKPLEAFVANPDLNCSFMILWANENWTRRWDGLDHDIILQQDYREEDDAALLSDWARYFRDPRYKRINGRPLLVLYRPGIIPDACATIARWRRKLRSEHQVDPYIFMTQGFGCLDPGEFGLDGAMEFPPHKVAHNLPSLIQDLEISDLRFTGQVAAYDAMVANAVMAEPAPYPLLRGVAPSWDNDARRQGGGMTYHGSTPQKYQAWLAEAISYARAHPFEGEALVFINAWNEWAEAAYLEPDVHFGGAYLNATARALTEQSVVTSKDKVVLFSHDAYRHGGQLLVKNMARVLTARYGVEVAIIVLGEGPLVAEYRKIAPTYQVGGDAAELEGVLASLRQDGYRKAIVNTTVSGWVLPYLKAQGYFAVSLIHELPRLIREYNLEPVVKIIAEQADLIVFPARQVEAGFAGVAGDLDSDKCILRSQGSYLPWSSDPQHSTRIRAKLGLKESDKLVINVGYADARKGIDIFLNVAREICARRQDVHFAWIGGTTADVQTWYLEDIAADAPEAGRIHVIPFTDTPVPYYEAADLFFLSSREDPFPTVVLEALKAGLPVVGLQGSGGSTDLIAEFGALVARGNLAGIAAEILGFLDLPEAERQQQAALRQAHIESRFRFEDYVGDLLRMLNPDLQRVSVVVPNYNYKDHLVARLDTVYGQSYPLYEVLVLDDCSADDSLQLLEGYRQQTDREFTLVVNEVNSGSGYRQWDKGMRMSRGDFVWIAEADDTAEPEFLDVALKLLEEEDVAFVFCDSAQRDEHDRLLSASYGYYFDTVEPGAMDRGFVMDGAEFTRRFLSVKNLILNVSGVVWRREALIRALDFTREDHNRMKVACDWKMYAYAAVQGGRVGYVAKALNMHRCHSGSVTHSRDGQQHYDEIVSVQEFIAQQVDLPAEILAKRETYRAELRQQFGLAD